MVGYERLRGSSVMPSSNTEAAVHTENGREQTRLTPLTPGERIELYRRQRHLSRRVVANLVGRSEEWLRLIECGRAHLDSLHVMMQLADVLSIDDVNELIDRPLRRPLRSGDSAADIVVPLQHVLVVHPMFTLDEAREEAVEPLSELSDELSACRKIWGNSWQRYSLLAERLPNLLAQSRIRHWQDESPESSELLIDAYHLAREFLTKVGAHSLAWTVADRAVAMTAHVEQPTAVVGAAWHAADALLHCGQPEECLHFASVAKRFVDAVVDKSDRIALSGALSLLAMRGAAAIPNQSEVLRLLAAAQQAVREFDTDHGVNEIHFGPTTVASAQVEIALWREDFDEAIRVGVETEVADVLPVGERARHHIALAYAFAQRRENVAAALTLAKAANICSEDLRFDPDAHRTLQYLIRCDNRILAADVARLAALAGLK
ncbi:helix-turn-helix domain-containing protein [Nocardia brasiliensis]